MGKVDGSSSEDESEDDEEDSDPDESPLSSVNPSQKDGPLEERKGADLESHKSLISNPIAQSEDLMYEVKMSESDSSSSADGDSILSRLRKQQEKKGVKVDKKEKK